MSDKKVILVVDDSVSNLKNAEEVLKEKYTLALVKSGKMALEYLKSNIPDLILLDVMMPELDGFETARRIKSNPATEMIPIIFLTVDANVETEKQGFSLGAQDFIRKPFEPEIMIYRIESIIELDSLRKRLEAQVSKKTRQLEMATLQVISCVADIVDNKSNYTKGHSVRVAGYAKEIASRMGFSEREAYDVYYISLLHDIGKLIAPYEKLPRFEGDYTPQERIVLCKHCSAGADLLKELTIFENIADGAAYHHERYDGEGNVSGFMGKSIPIIARIICVANAYDNMKSFRSYRKPYSDSEAKEIISKEKGKMFDPEIADVLIAMIDEGFEPTGAPDNGEAEITKFGNAVLQRVINEYADEIKIESQKDALTGLWNRRYAESAINEYLDKNGSNGVMFMLDMDNFKQINDRFGHIKGDHVLMQFADVISSFRGNGDIICRIGGDEFIMFSPDISDDDVARNRAEELIKALKDKIELENFEFSVSIGIAFAPNDGTSFTELYNNSDKALYFVKQNGRGGAHFFSDVHKRPVIKNNCETLADLNFIKSMLANPDETLVEVESSSFKNIYHFIESCISRTQQNVALALFTLTDYKGESPDIMSLEQAGELFNTSVCENIRRGDIFTSFSSMQYVVIIMNVNIEYGNMVAQRIKDRFDASKGELPVKLHFDVQPIEVQ